MSSWRSFLLRISDKCSEYGSSTDFKEHIETCYGVVRRELEHSGNDILPYLLQCVEQLPHKIPLYGTVVGLLNLENEDFIRKVVEYTQTNLQDALYSENCNRIRIFMRFLTVMMCSKVLQPSSLVAVFETLLSSAATTVDEEKGNPSWQPRADFYVSCILSSLPWGGAELTEQVPEEIDRIMVGVESYLSLRRSVSDVGLSCFEDGDEIEKGLGVKDDVQNEEGIGEKDLLKDLWARIRLLSRNGWKLDSVPRPHLSFEAQLVSGKSHELGPISCPEQPNLPSTLSGIAFGKQKHDAELKYPQRIRRLNIFPASKTEELQPIDRFIVEEYLLDILLFFNGSRKECIQFMASLHVPFRYEYLMAETIFSQLLLLPHPPFKPLYYTLVIIDLCKALPGAFPSVVAGAVRALFEKIADLDMECRTRLILWFSHHLSNFQFIWPWEEWAFVIDLPKWAPQRVFVQEVLDRQVRLSYREKVKQSIENAPVLNELLPPKGVPNFRYSIKDGTERIEEHTLSDELSLMVKEKQTAREVISWIEVSVFPVHGSEVTLKIVVQTLLDIGSKSFTHLVTILERYGQVLSHLCPDEDKQVLLIEEVASYWKDSSQMRAIVIDRMMNYRLVSNLSVVRWVFAPENIDQFHTSDHPWEVLRSAIGKTYNLISDLRKGIPSLAKSVVSAEEAVAKANAEVEAAESKLTLMDGEPVVGENPVRLKRLKSYAEKAKDDEASARKSLREKEAFLGRAIGENEALFVYLYKSFSKVLNERLPESVTLEELKSSSSQGDAMAVDVDVDVDVDESAAAMEVEDGNERPNTRQLNGESANNGYNVGEKEQLCLSTLGYVKAFSRQYASEIWPIVEKLDAEVLTENGHPLFKKAVYSGLRR